MFIVENVQWSGARYVCKSMRTWNHGRFATSQQHLRGFPTFKSEIDPHFSEMSFWLYLHVI